MFEEVVIDKAVEVALNTLHLNCFLVDVVGY
jgi:hypothetical protein